jgi:hypothetical protein
MVSLLILGNLMQARRYQQDVAALDQVFEYIMQSLANYRWVAATRVACDRESSATPGSPCASMLAVTTYEELPGSRRSHRSHRSGPLFLQDDVPADAGARQGWHPGAHDQWAQPLGQGETPYPSAAVAAQSSETAAVTRLAWHDYTSVLKLTLCCSRTSVAAAVLCRTWMPSHKSWRPSWPLTTPTQPWYVAPARGKLAMVSQCIRTALHSCQPAC